METPYELFPNMENRDTFFRRVHTFMLPYHRDALLIANAYQTAKDAFRKVKRSRGERYFEHCRAVSLILMDYADIRDPSVIAAGLLHDIVEDVDGWTVERVRREFGAKVGALVGALTMPEGEFESREARLLAYHAALLAGPEKALSLKFADRVHNLSTCESVSFARQFRMVEETERVYLPLAKERGVLDRLLGTMCAAVRERLAKHTVLCG